MPNLVEKHLFGIPLSMFKKRKLNKIYMCRIFNNLNREMTGIPRNIDHPLDPTLIIARFDKLIATPNALKDTGQSCRDCVLVKDA